MAYVPTDPTGTPPAHLVAMDIGQLVHTLKNDANALLVNGRINVTPDLIGINHEIKYIIDILINRAVQIEEREKQKQEELDTAKGLLKYLQEVNTAREREINNVRRRAGLLQNERDVLRNERDALVIANNNQAYDLQEQQTRQRRIRDALQQRNTRLTDQLAIERLTSRNLGRIRARMQAQIAVLRIQAQWFRIRQVGPGINNPPPPINTPQVVWLPLQ
jgi:hypothetical protein